jgi:hypothetical protein
LPLTDVPPGKGEPRKLQVFLGCIRRFQLRARLDPPWHPRDVSSLTDPTVQCSRSVYLNRARRLPPDMSDAWGQQRMTSLPPDSYDTPIEPQTPRVCRAARNAGSGLGAWRRGPLWNQLHSKQQIIESAITPPQMAESSISFSVQPLQDVSSPALR